MTLLPQSRPLSRHDLAAMPDDGHRYELIDGTLIVTPAPSHRHQLAQSRLLGVLIPRCPRSWMVVVAPTDVVMADDTVVEPDILIVDSQAFRDEARPVEPLLVIEVLSPSTRLIDLSLKKARYEQAGCPSYWVLDPEVPSLTAWDLSDGAYVQTAHVEAEETFTATRPFAVRLTPAELLA